MKNSSNYPAFVLVLCFCLSIGGNGLFARPEQRPYSLQKHALKKNKYYYYPRQNVYHDPLRNVYFIWERTYWKQVTHLPGNYVSVTDPGSPRFTLWITSKHPYYYNEEHRKTYYKYRVSSASAARVSIEN